MARALVSSNMTGDESLTMTTTRLGIGLVAAVGFLTMALSLVAIWLVLQEPLTVASAISTGSVTPVVRALANLLLETWYTMVRYL